MVVWILLWKTKKFEFLPQKIFFHVEWHSNCHRSKALIIRNKFNWQKNTSNRYIFAVRGQNIPFVRFQKRFFKVHFWAPKLRDFQVFNSFVKIRFRKFTTKYWNWTPQCIYFLNGVCESFPKLFQSCSYDNCRRFYKPAVGRRYLV